MTSFKWSLLQLRGKKEITTKTKKTVKLAETNENKTEDQEMEEEKEEKEENEKDDEADQSELNLEDSMNIEELKINSDETNESEVFQLTLATKDVISNEDVQVKIAAPNLVNAFLPHPRRSSFLQFHKSNLYLYGGKFEDRDDKELTLNDMYSLNLKKLDEWNIICEDKELKLENSSGI